MVHFAKVRLSGFKSFVDPTEVDIAAGLTGIVGPNGCGKSNILEGLRWCMGEGSARQLRGGGMDDVIFNGTTDRPARNIAEVAIHLDNSDRTAPSAFNNFDELEVVRRIERDSGSSYRVNGQDVRARDVQLLFADLSTGARSTAIVSQGRIGALINAKPEGRRLLIEEAAGITGLHSRRHEAELRLRAAETNLERLEDVVTTLGGQLQGLKRQARQATRYRNLSEQIRSTEAMVLHQRWQAAQLALDEAKAQLAAVSEEVATLTAESARLSTGSADLGSKLPALREAEASAAAALHRHMVARDTLDTEEQRLTARRSELEARIAQVDADLAREQAHHQDAEAALARLQEEAAALGAGQDDSEAIDSARADKDGLRQSVEAMETQATGLTRQIATRTAEREGLERRTAELAERLEQLQARRAAAETELAALPREGLDAEALAAEEAVGRTEADLRQRRTDAAAAETARDTARDTADAARAALQDAEQALNEIQAEQRAIRSLLDQPTAQPGTAVVDATRVTPGYEAALGAALGDDLDASLDGQAAVHWQETETPGDAPALPSGVKPLSWYVEA
ncbi:MAG: AAA family ATPase, partial [Bauldia litoralis]